MRKIIRSAVIIVLSGTFAVGLFLRMFMERTVPHFMNAGIVYILLALTSAGFRALIYDINDFFAGDTEA